MNKQVLFLSIAIFFTTKIYAQIGISATNTPPNASAMLDVSSTSKGILIPRLTTIQKNAIPNKAEGLTVYDTDLKQFSYWIGAGPIGYWTDFPQAVTTPPNYWTLNGNDISSNNTGNVGIGIANPTLAKFQVIENSINQPVHSAIWANNTSNGNGITGNAFNAGIGVWGTSGTGTGVEGRTTGSSINSYGIFGNATGSGTGGYFYSASGTSLIANGTASIGSNSTPNPSAILDVSSTSKGFLPPRMTSSQRTNIATPADGLLVFDSDTQSYWFRQSGAWTELPKNNYWQLNGSAGNEIKNTNSGGIWSANSSGLTFGFYGSDDTSNPPTAPSSGAGTRMMWIPSRSAFRVGTTFYYPTFWDANNIGLFSFATGADTKASGRLSTAMGIQTTALGFSSTALGAYGTASGDYSTAMSYFTTASGYASTAMGYYTTSSALASTAMGYRTTASGNYSTAMGIYNIDNPNGLFMVGNGANGNPFNAFIIRRDNNRVGIGIENPLASLHVAGSGSVSTGQGGFFYPSTALTFNPSVTANLGILADEGIVSKTYVGSAINVVASDSRIKKDFSLSNNSEDLALLKRIEITNYRMKDVTTWGNQAFKKVIAQQVESVYPEVIKKQTSTIPDIYSLAESVVYDAVNKKLSILLSKDYSIKIGDKIELVHPEKGKIQTEVESVSGNTFTVKDWQYATDKIFVFGREVKDFRSVDYEALSMLGISAIQQLAKEVEELKNQNFKLKADFNARLDAIEAALKPQTGK